MADCLFMALDQHRIDRKGDASVLEVLGIHVGPENEAWVQVALEGEPAHGVVLHLPPRATAAQAIARLDAWAETPPDRRPRLIRVAQPADTPTMYPSRVVFAQSLAEYGAGAGLMDRMATLFQSSAQWVQSSLREHSSVWLTVGLALVVGFWLFRAR